MIHKIHHAPAWELVADQLRRAIHLGRFLPGHRLPAERELATQLGVSRTTVRDAIRVLESEALVESRRGPSGGLVVLRSETSPSDLRTALERGAKQLEDVFEFRLANESACARLAAQRRTASQLHVMAQALTVMDRCMTGGDDPADMAVSKFRGADSEFHLTIGLAAGNPLLQAAVEDARAAMFLPIGAVFAHLEPTANALHRELFEAIESRDGERAAAAMVAHIEGTRDSVREVFEGLPAAHRRERSAGSVSGSTPPTASGIGGRDG